MLPAYAGMIPSTATGPIGARSAPRVCGDDPHGRAPVAVMMSVLPAYAGMIPRSARRAGIRAWCSPRMRG